MNDVTPLTAAEMRRAGLDAIRKAELARNRAHDRKWEIQEEVLHQLRRQEHLQLPWWRRRFTNLDEIVIDQRLLKSVVNIRCSNDPVWKTAIADNRWYLDQATAYGVNGFGDAR